MTGHRIRQARTAKGLTLKLLTERTGIGQSTLSRIESGKQQPSFAEVCVIAAALEWPLIYFATGRTGPGKDPRELVVQFAFRGIDDLVSGEPVLIGEAREIEDLLSIALSDGSSSRIIESIPALLLRNEIDSKAALAAARRDGVVRRLGWMAELSEWIASHLEVGLVAPTARDSLRTIRMTAEKEIREKEVDPFLPAMPWDSFGRPLPGLFKRIGQGLPPLQKKWGIWYETPQEDFLRRAKEILERARV